MNFKERLLVMEREFAEESSRQARENVEELLISFIFKFQIFEPCKYVSEDDDWITFFILPQEDILESQIMSLRKDEIVSFGILNENNIIDMGDFEPQVDSESLYQ